MVSIKDKLKSLVTASAKESEVSPEVMERMKKQAEAASQTGKQIRTEKE
jgi:hypothetical protein